MRFSETFIFHFAIAGETRKSALILKQSLIISVNKKRNNLQIIFFLIRYLLLFCIADREQGIAK